MVTSVPWCVLMTSSIWFNRSPWHYSIEIISMLHIKRFNHSFLLCELMTSSLWFDRSPWRYSIEIISMLHIKRFNHSFYANSWRHHSDLTDRRDADADRDVGERDASIHSGRTGLLLRGRDLAQVLATRSRIPIRNVELSLRVGVREHSRKVQMLSR